MQLRIKSSDDEACTHALLELITSTIKNVIKCWLLELSNNHHHYEESQSNSKNDDENEAFEAISSD